MAAEFGRDVGHCLVSGRSAAVLEEVEKVFAEGLLWIEAIEESPNKSMGPPVPCIASHCH